MYSRAEIEDIFDGYLEALVWAEYVQAESDPDSGSENRVEDSECPWEKKSLKILHERVTDFLAIVPRALYDAYTAKHGVREFGADLYFTGHGHGVGFWDRGDGYLGTQLSDLCPREDTYVCVYYGRLCVR